MSLNLCDLFKGQSDAQRLECSPMARETWVQSQVILVEYWLLSVMFNKSGNNNRLKEVKLHRKIIVFSHHHHYHVAPSAWISLTLFRHPSESTIASGRSSGLHPVSTRGSWSPCLCAAMWRGPQEYITYEFVPTFPAVPLMSGSSNMDISRDGW